MNYLTNENVSITVVNYPLPASEYDEDELSINSIVSGSFGVGIFTIALAFKFASIANHLVRERETGSKDQQVLNGMNMLGYWSSNFIFDYLTYCLIAGFGIGMCYVLDIQSFVKDEETVRAFCSLFLLYGVSNVLFTYLVSYAFQESYNAQIGVFFFNFVNGGILTVLMILIRAINKDE